MSKKQAVPEVQEQAENERRRPTARKDMTKTQWTLKEMRRNYIAYIMVAPYYLVFTLFTVAPVALSIFFGFTIFNIIEPPKFVFFDNYIRLFLDDDIFIIAAKNTLVFAVITGPVSYTALPELTPWTSPFVTVATPLFDEDQVMFLF